MTDIFQMGWFNHQLENHQKHGGNKIHLEKLTINNCLFFLRDKGWRFFGYILVSVSYFWKMLNYMAAVGYGALFVAVNEMRRSKE